MKTPIQQLIDEINRQRCLLIEKQFEVQMRLEDIRWQNLYDGMIKSLGDVESMLKTRYLKKEKDVIVEAFSDGLTHYPNDGDPRYAENYYNENFNTKE